MRRPVFSPSMQQRAMALALSLALALPAPAVIAQTAPPVATVTLPAGSAPVPPPVYAPPPPPAAAVAGVDAGRFITLPKITEAEIRELILDGVTQLEVQRGFNRSADAALPAGLGAAPPQVVVVANLSKQGFAGPEVMRLGYMIAPRRLPQLWVGGNAQGDIAALEPALKVLLTERTKLMAKLRLSDLEARVINLSYTDADAVLFALRAMGYSAITQDDPLPRQDAYRGDDVPIMEGVRQPEAPEVPAAIPAAGFPNPADANKPPSRFQALKHMPSSIANERLPLIVRMPAPEARTVGLVGATDTAVAATRDQLGLTVIPQAANPLADTMAGSTTQLMVLFHPGYPEQFFKLRRLIQDVIDKPARQVFVEGLVLEISEEGLRELGVKWDIKKGNQAFTIGNIGEVVPGSNTLSFLRDNAAAVSPTQIIARINALVEKNQAEILSRPSVLTLDNRQATIRVGTDIPVATSQDASAAGQGSTRVSFSFQYIPTGILLNVRPRINEDATEISMVIDATVSATVPGANLNVLDPATRIPLASAPTISTRRVQTYARIRDNTPLIIGGLVSRDQIKGSAQVPGLAKIPVVGRLFGSESKTDNRREVIIVLTPSVVTENIRETKAQYPRDDDRFDLFDTTLFKEQYRIRAEDLIDSSYIRFNRRFLAYRDAVNRLVEKRPELVNRAPFNAWTGGKLPGEFIFVSGMMYRMLDRLNAGAAIRPENLMLFEVQSDAGEVRPISITNLMARYGDGKDYKSFFEKQKGKALALTFTLGRASTMAADLFSEPTPEVRLLNVPDRNVWRQTLWELNQPVDGRQRFTILIHEPNDLRRLQLAYATQNTVLNNGNVAGQVFDRWLPGRLLQLQEVSPKWERILVAPIAQYFFIGEHFYMYFMREHDRAIETMDRELKKPEFAESAALRLQ